MSTREPVFDYGPLLLPQHQELLRASGIAPEVTYARGYRSVTTKVDLRGLGFSANQWRVPALLIPVRNVFGEIALYQIRPDEPRIVEGKAVKYETPRGSRLVLDVPPRARQFLGDPSRPLFITEGIRKADAAVSRDLCCIDVIGVWGWRGTNEHGGKVALPDWESVALSRRDCYIAYDSDVMVNLHVHKALARLKAFLESRGARVLLIYLPPAAGSAKVGLDDYLAAGHSVEELLALAAPELRPLRGQAERDREQADADLETRLAQLREQASPVLSAADPLPLVQQSIRGLGYGGDIRPAILVYLAATSRLLQMRPGAMPVHVVLLGIPSVGKSFTLNVVLRLLPPEAFHVIDAGSPRALIYDRADLRHRALVFGEADSLPAGEDNPAASAVRNLLQEHRLRYKVVVRNSTGQYEVQEVVKPGPTVLLTTAVRRLGDQLDSRLFRLEVPDDVTQVRAALSTQATIELGGIGEPDVALLAFQASLQELAPWDVVIPFVRELSSAIQQSIAAPRILRDFARLNSLVKTVAVLRHRHRRRDPRGRLIAEVDDYRAVFDLLRDMYEGSASGASRGVREAVAAVRILMDQRGGPVTVTIVARELGISKMSASRRVNSAMEHGWLCNTEDRRGRPANLTLGEPMPASEGLPDPDSLSRNVVTPETDGEGEFALPGESSGEVVVSTPVRDIPAAGPSRRTPVS